MSQQNSDIQPEPSYRQQIVELFCAHPNSVNQTYWSHWKDAMRFSLTCGWCGLALFVHAFFPCLLSKTGSDHIISLWEEMMAKRQIAQENTVAENNSENSPVE